MLQTLLRQPPSPHTPTPTSSTPGSGSFSSFPSLHPSKSLVRTIRPFLSRHVCTCASIDSTTTFLMATVQKSLTCLPIISCSLQPAVLSPFPPLQSPMHPPHCDSLPPPPAHSFISESRTTSHLCDGTLQSSLKQPNVAVSYSSKCTGCPRKLKTRDGQNFRALYDLSPHLLESCERML